MQFGQVRLVVFLRALSKYFTGRGSVPSPQKKLASMSMFLSDSVLRALGWLASV